MSTGKSCRIDSTNIFLICSSIGIVLFVFLAPILGQKSMEWIVMENNPYYGSLDYFKLIPYSQHLSDVYYYGKDQFYPPLTYLFAYYLFRVTTYGSITDNIKDVPMLPYQLTIYVMINCMAMVWFVVLLYKLLKKKRIPIIMCVLLSVPMFAGVIERGNPAFFVMLLVLQALAWRNSGNRIQNELALIMLGVAFALKLYPFVIGLLYLKERRIKDFFKFGGYAFFFFSVPFVWFGGINGLIRYLDVLKEFSMHDFGARCEFFKGLLSFAGINGALSGFLNVLFLLVLILCVFFSESKMRTLIFLASIMALYPNNSFRYTLIYYIIVLHAVFDERTNRNVENCVYAFFLGNIFSIPTIYGVVTGFGTSLGIYSYTHVERYIYFFVWLFLVFALLFEVYSILKKERK